MNSSAHRVPAQCPFCKTQHEFATNLETGDAPVPSSITICAKCGEWSVFTHNMTLRRPYHTEYEAIVADPLARRVRAAWVEVYGKKASPPPRKRSFAP